MTTRSKIDTVGWLHHDISITICIKCKHRIYQDEPHERNSFVDSSGNNDDEYWHKECPSHKTKVVRTVTHYRCTECGVTGDSDDIIGI